MADDDLDRLVMGAIGAEAQALASALTPSHLPAGRRLSHYRIIETIGEGGMGVVYKAEDEKLQRLVAIKVLQARPLVDHQLRARLEHEARAASQLDHPSICTVHDFDEQDGHRFIVMELLTGQTLRDRAAAGIDETEAIRLAIAVADALEAAHERKIIHCDIKPANIFLTHRGDVKVLDFGISKLQSSDLGARPRESSGSAGGTRAYMSPEQARGENVDERTDIFALGAVLRELVPAPGKGLARVIERMADTDPSRRYQHMREARVALQALSGHGRRRWMLAAAALVLVLIGSAAWALRPRAAVLAERDWILVGHFDNRTSDPVFTDVLTDVVSVQLGQSPYLIVFPEARIAEQLGLMRRPAEQRLTADVASEICERAGIKAFVTGSIVSVGAHYLVRLDVVNARTGDYLASEQVDAADRGAVLKAISQASSTLRGRLGESYQSIEKFDVSAESATTASLDALRAFRLGQEQLRLGTSNSMKAVPFFRRAIEIDPEFSLAYARLAVAYANARENKRSEEASAKAFQHRARVSERERYEIETRYYDNVSGEVTKAVEAVEMWAEAYPADPRPFNTLSAYYKNLGQLERAAETGEKALSLLPTSGVYYSNLAGAYVRLSQFARAAEICEKAITAGLDNSTTHRFLQTVALVNGDAALAAREEAWRAKRTSDFAHVEYQASVAGAQGRIGDARRLYRQAIALTDRQGLSDRADEYRLRLAQLELLTGHAAEAIRSVEPILDGDAGRLLQADAAFVLAVAGDRRHADVFQRLSATFPDDEYLARLWTPLVAAAAALHAGRPADAVEQLRLLDTYDRGDHAALRPSYYLGIAQLAAGNHADAQRAFQKVIDNRGVIPTSSMYALAHLGLARAAAAGIDAAAARAAYDRFFAMWKDADPDLPVMKAARAGYARLTPRS
jgi:tetratricopeptide (TPR) repeat protein